MTPVDCEFEAEALAAAIQSRWPENVDEELRTHVEACPICSDVVTMALAFDEAREDSKDWASVPDPGRVWRSAQVRARCEAADKAMTPIRITQMIGFASAFGIAGACFGASSGWLQSMLTGAMNSFSGEHVHALVAFAAQHGFALAGAAILIVLVPTAAWLTASGE